MTPSSLRLQLLLLLLGPLAAIVAVNTAIAYRDARVTAGLVTDNTLLASAHSIAEQVRATDGAIEAIIPPAALGMFASSSRDLVYFEVRSADGELLAGFPDMPPPPEPVPELQPLYFDAVLRGNPIRAVALRQLVPAPQTEYWARVSVGVTLRARETMVADLWQQGFLQQLLLLLVAAALAWLGLNRGLQPLLRLREAVASRARHEFTPFAVASVQSEVQPLVAALNQYMERLQRQIAARRRFIANAAHQLRTPLALLRTQADFALRSPTPEEKDEALGAILAGTRQMARLTTQLLTLSRAEAATVPRRERVEIAALAARVLEEHAGLALARRIDLGFEEKGAGAVVGGDPAMLRELLANLVDNALRYTPAGGRVTVRARADGKHCVIEVEDDGPGIPEAERERAFERFYRLLGTSAEGSGLGLAIVREIALASGGTVALDAPPSGRGLLVEIRLPAAG
jgi:two-component system sensor histidine kinase TctE